MKRRDFVFASGVALTAGVRQAMAAACPPAFVARPISSINPSDTTSGNPALTSCGLGPAPAWFTALADKTWSTVAGGAGQRIIDVAPSPAPPGNSGLSTVTGAYCGGCVLQETGELILPANGGHTDYSGNEIYALNLRAATPAWQRISNPTPNSQIAPTSTGFYSDGKPSAVHGWGRAAAGGGKVLLASLEAVYNSGQTVYTGAMWNRATDTWANLGTALSGAGLDGLTQGGCSAYDSVSNKFYNAIGYDYGAYSNRSWTINADSGAKTLLPVSANNRQPRWCAIADDLRIWVLGCPSSGHLLVLDIANSSASLVSVGFSGSMPTDGSGCVYHKASRAFLLWHNSGQSLIKLSIPSNPLTGTYSFTTVSAAGGVTPSVGSESQPYGRFNIIEDMGNGQSCLVLATTTTGATHVYKLPTGGV